MQTIWSRAAQARCLCNCPTCVSVTAATARRTTTATAKRGIRRGDVYTVFASSLAATAALADSRKKDLRSQQWERIIAEIREQVQAKKEEQQARLASLSQAEEAKPLEGGDRDDFRQDIKQTVQSSWRPIRPYSYVDSWTNVFNWAAQQDIERAAAGFQDWKGPSLSLLRSLSSGQLHKLLTDERLLRRFYGGPSCAALVDVRSERGFSAKKSRTLEWSIAKLVLKLLFYSSGSSQPAENEVEIPVQMPSQVTENSSPNEPIILVEAPAENASRVNATISHKENTSKGEADLPDSAQKREQPQFLMQGLSFEDRIAQIDAHIFSLLVGGSEKIMDTNSSFFKDFESPPLPNFRGNIANKFDEAFELNNSLKSLLDPLKCTDDIDSSISKIVYNLLICQTPPNVHTYNMLLVRFCHLDNYKMFRAVLASMRESHIKPNELTHSTVLRYFTMTDRGNFFMEYVLRMEGHLTGLALADTKQEISPISSQRYHIFFNGEGKKKIAEKARMNGEVYEALIAGALRFFGPQSAMQYYRDMISEGWQASVDLLIEILKSCYRRCDWDAGVSVWPQITAISDRANSRAFEWMLCLCQACGQHVAFEQILQDGVNAGALPSSMLPLSDCVKYQNLDSPCEDAETPETSTLDKLTSESAPASWVEKHLKNRIAADAMAKNEERPVARAVLADSVDSVDSVPVSWVERYNTRSMTESKSSNEEPLPAKEGWQKTRAVFTTAKTYDYNVRLRMVHGLAGKVKEFNEKDSLKMNHKEYKQYRYKLRGRLVKNGQLISRSFFERYKTAVDSKLEREDQEGRVYHEPSPFTALDLGHFVANPGSLSSDDGCMCSLAYRSSSANTLGRSSHPTSGNEQDEVLFENVETESSSSVDDYTSHLLHDPSSMPATVQFSRASSTSELEELPRDILARLDYTSRPPEPKSSSEHFPHPSSGS